MWRAKYGLEAAALAKLTSNTLDIYLGRYRDRIEVAEKVVDQCMREFLAGQCLLCKGAREVLHGELMVQCPDCHGSGVRCFRDDERSIAMGLSWALTKRMAHKINWVLGMLTAEDRFTNQHMAMQLEREREKYLTDHPPDGA